jgi:ribose transport system ATP-binding protein
MAFDRLGETDRADGRAAVLLVEGITKSFGGQIALDDVTFSLNAGEVHALLGENGSGKSTLIKLLAGYHRPDHPTQLIIHDVAYPLPLAAEQALAAGLCFVHQDLGLINELTVAENVRSPVVTAKGRWWVNPLAQRRYTQVLFARWGIPVSPGARVEQLTGSERAQIAIARALDSLDVARARRVAEGVIFLDETTAYLPTEGVEALFAVVRQFADQGGTAVFVSHDLDEALAHSDRITVLRDGRRVATRKTSELDHDELVQLLVGRSVARTVKTHPRDAEATAMRVTGLIGKRVRELNIEVGRSEILGLTGLLGSGFDEVPDLLFGVTPAEAGRMIYDGREFELSLMTPHDAVHCGIALVPSDRLNQGGIQGLSVDHNVSMQNLATLGRSWALNHAFDREANRELISEYGVTPPEPNRLMAQLSGGNQQKVILCKWLRLKPKFLLLQEPTQGVDVGARADIYNILLRFRDEGASIICASSDHDQLAQLCDRVLVFEDGLITRELSGDEVDKSTISTACLRS